MKITYLDSSKDWQESVIRQRHGKSVCITRYGAFGDLLQLTTILDGLREQGFHICVNTTPKGLDILRTDPRIDEFLIQEDDWVPNGELDYFWFFISRSFEKYINLSESVEGSLLALSGRHSFKWSKEFRHMVMDVNYLEGHHAIAGIPFENPSQKFFPTKKEGKWAGKQRLKLGNKNFVIMWSVAGSSIHKVYPYMDQVMEETLSLYPDTRFILVGDVYSQIGEVGWEKNKKVLCRSGKWSIRESLAMSQRCDMVIGPETGIMNAVSFEPMPKILMLSHSSPENIGKHWVNTTTLEPTAGCHPCHQLHYGFDTCQRDEFTGTAKCAASLTPDIVVRAINNNRTIEVAA